MTGSSRRLRALVVIAASGVSAPASAQPAPPGRPAAETLFREGRKLMDEGHYEEACPKLAESNRIEPAGGTLLNLAMCHEFTGKTATAWAEYQQALGQARKAGRGDREKMALQHAAALVPKLSHLTVSIPAPAAVPELVVTLDGAALDPAELGTPIPVDPGLHSVTAAAPGRQRWETQVQVGIRGDARSVTIPVLLAGSGTQAPAAPPPPPDAGGGWHRPAALVAGGAGVVALGVGAVFGIRALSLGGQSNAHCQNGLCDATGLSAFDDGKTSAGVADATLLAGAVVLGAAAVLFLTDDSPARAAVTGSVRLTIGRDGASAGVRGTW
jgi:hypothetical protein